MKTILLLLLLLPIIPKAQKLGKWKVCSTVVYRPNDSTQIEYYPKGEVDTIKVQWLNDRQYKLITVTDTLHVLITNYSEHGYECLITNGIIKKQYKLRKIK